MRKLARIFLISILSFSMMFSNSIIVLGEDFPPIAIPETIIITAENIEQTVFERAVNVYDPDNNIISIELVQNLTNGQISFAETGTSFCYTPNQGFFGSDSFQYFATAGGKASATVTVTIVFSLIDTNPTEPSPLQLSEFEYQTSGTQLLATLQAKNTSETFQNTTLFAVLYGNDGKIKDVSIQNITDLPSGESTNPYFSFSENSNIQNSEIKIMAWNNFDTISPRAIPITKNIDTSISFEQISLTLAENSSTVIKVLRQGDVSGNTTATIEIIGGTASNSDYFISPLNISFAPEETEKQITIDAVNDAIGEMDETIILNIASTVGATIGQNSQLTSIIDDDEELNRVFLEKASDSISEGTSFITVKVMKEHNNNYGNCSVLYYTSNQSAVAGVDYISTSGTLTFTPSETQKTINIPIINNQIYKGNLSFSINLKTPTNTSISSGRETITILEDDNKPLIGFKKLTESYFENAGNIEIKVSRTANTNGIASVSVYAEGSSTALEYEDFNEIGMVNLTFADGETEKTITITPINDSILEGTETIRLALFNPSSNAQIDSNMQFTTISLLDDEAVIAPPTITGSDDGSMNISVEGVQPGDKLRLYQLVNGSPVLKQGPTNIPGTTWNFNLQFEGNDYFVTRQVGDIESAASNIVNVTSPPITPPEVVGDIGGTILIEKGTDIGTIKVIILNMNGKSYYYSVGDIAETTPQINSVFGMESWKYGGGMQSPMLELGVDNIPAISGQVISIIEVNGTGFGDSVTGFSSIVITNDKIK